MQYLHNLPIKHKLMAILMLVSGTALVMASAAFMIYERAAVRKEMVQTLGITAALTGANSTAGLSFNEAGSVEQALESLNAQPDIVQACVYDKNGKPFARFVRDAAKAKSPPPVTEVAASHFDGQCLNLFQPINLAGETIGTIYLQEDLSRMTRQTLQYALLGTSILFMSAVVALLLSAQLQKVISNPLSELADTVALVRTKKNYSVRAIKRGNDELGSLIDGFNEMLAQIQERDINLEQRVAERTEELRGSQARFKFIFESVPVGIASHMVHPDGRVTREVNAAHLNICGLTREQHDIPGIYVKLTHPADFAKQEEYMRQVNEGKINQFSLEKRYLRHDGATVWVAFSYQRQHYAPGSFEELTTLVDITGFKRAAEALRESEASYYSLVDQMPAGIFRKDKEGRYIFVNSWFCRAKGVKPEDFLGKLPQELPVRTGNGDGVLESDSAFLAAAGTEHHIAIMNTGRQIEFDEKSTGHNGKATYFHAVKSPVFGPDGAVVGSQGILLDVTQRKLAEAELAYERDLLRTFLENSMDHIYFKDLQSRFIKVSKSQARQFGLASADALIGKTDFDFFTDEHARPAFEDEQQIIRTGQPIIGRIERESWQDGRKDNWVLTTKMALRDKAGEIIGTFGISKDITPIKEAEAQLEKAHRQLLETSRLAGMAEVATSVLHNVGNVLNSVNVSATLVLDLVKKSRISNLGRLAALINQQPDLAAFFTTDPRGRQLPGYLAKLAEHLAKEQADLVAEVELTRKNIEHIKDIVTMQQNYAKVSGVVEKVKVTDMVEDALRMNAGALARHQVEVVRDYPAETVECNVERQKVLQILVNLIRNAKYACDESNRPDKRLTMQVRLINGHVQIVTLDNGVGIPAENMTRIFSHGFTTRQSGHGFGLHSGALAARELGGSLSAYSDGCGTGARFVLDLPLEPPKKS